MILSPKVHLAMTGGIFDFYNVERNVQHLVSRSQECHNAPEKHPYKYLHTWNRSTVVRLENPAQMTQMYGQIKAMVNTPLKFLFLKSINIFSSINALL